MKTKKMLGIVFASMTLLALGGCTKAEEKGNIEGGSGEEVVVSDSSAEVAVGEVSLKDDGYFKDIVTDGIDPKIKDEVSYKTEYENSDWDNIKFVIDHVKVVTVDKYKDKDDKPFSTLVSLDYKIYNEDSTDKHITPDKAYLVLSDGTKVDAEVFMDYWNDEILTKDKHKDGYLHFKAKDEEKLSDIKAIDITFKADGDKTHTYNVELPLEPEK